MSVRLFYSYPTTKKGFSESYTSSTVSVIKEICPNYPTITEDDIRPLRAVSVATNDKFYLELANRLEESPDGHLILTEEY